MAWMLLLALMPEPEPARFEFKLETNTLVSLHLNGQEIKPGVTYKSEPLYADAEVEMEIRYVCGGEVKKETFTFIVTPGKKMLYTLTLRTTPPLVLAC